MTIGTIILGFYAVVVLLLASSFGYHWYLESKHSTEDDK